MELFPGLYPNCAVRIDLVGQFQAICPWTPHTKQTIDCWTVCRPLLVCDLCLYWPPDCLDCRLVLLESFTLVSSWFRCNLKSVCICASCSLIFLNSSCIFASFVPRVLWLTSLPLLEFLFGNLVIQILPLSSLSTSSSFSPSSSSAGRTM